MIPAMVVAMAVAEAKILSHFNFFLASKLDLPFPPLIPPRNRCLALPLSFAVPRSINLAFCTVDDVQIGCRVL